MCLLIILLKRSPQYVKSCREKRCTTNHAQVELLYSGPGCNHFNSVSCDELSDLVPRWTLKYCMLDPIPASVLKNCYDLLLPFITKVVICSLQNSTLTSDMKRAIVRPSLKKPSLDYQLYKNHRPISNLIFLSKCCEKVVASEFISHLQENKLEEIFQSAYKVGHSTESALLLVHNDVLRALDDGKCVMLVPLDLSAVFDTVDRGILLSRISQCIGAQGSAYTWFGSYLSSRSQFVQIRDTSSSDHQLTCGLPQGSVLGPVLYLVYTSPLGAILRRHGVGFHMYVDDTQLYLSMKTTKMENVVPARTRVEVYLRELNQWMLLNNFRLNNDKTELLAKHRPKPPLDSITVGDATVEPTSSARNIGAIFNDTMSFAEHVNDLCKTTFYHIRNISRISSMY